MLKFLAIQNIVLIDKAEIEFSSGLCVLSGETGSGKSILLDALGLAIGLRSNSRLIGNIENKASVTAEFDISKNESCKEILQNNDLTNLENPNLLNIRRIISDNGTGKVYINDILVGVNLLGQIGENLIEIHGQHDQRGLLNSSFHIKILDEFAKNNTLLKDLEKNYKELKETENKIAEIKLKRDAAEKERDYLNYIINELKNANLKEGEEENLSRKKDQLQGREKILNFLSELKSNLLESNSHLLLSQKILIRNQHIINNYLPLEKENLENLSAKIDEQNGAIENFLSIVESLEREVNSNDENFEEVEARLFHIKSLARKFNTTSDNLPQIIDDAKEKLSLLQNEEIFTTKLEEQRKKLINEYFKIADKLNEKRKKSALILAKKVEEELQFLKMDGVKFLVEVSEEKDDLNYRISGYNKVRFLASINKNNFDDIAKIASGGELSRFMLALKVALIEVKSCPSLIFDEIDSGIGGSTADAVGKRLKAIAKDLQVLIVTHQPQIAAKADNHFRISKIRVCLKTTQDNDKLFASSRGSFDTSDFGKFSSDSCTDSDDSKMKTIIEKLDDKNREVEIARMLSGEKITNEALAAANRLIY